MAQTTVDSAARPTVFLRNAMGLVKSALATVIYAVAEHSAQPPGD